jgi:hypothetical protein
MTEIVTYKPGKEYEKRVHGVRSCNPTTFVAGIEKK